MKNYINLLFVSSLLLFGSLQSPQASENSRILAMGDSLMAWNGIWGQSISDAIEGYLGEPVNNTSRVGSFILNSNFERQFSEEGWDWVVMNGGGNDLWLGCGCTRCEAKMDRIISVDSQIGRIPDLISKIRSTGARVIYVGYLRSPGVGSPIEHCKDEGAELEHRIASFAERTEGVMFLSLVDLVPFGDLSYHNFDMIHPSRKASRAIGRLVAVAIRQAEAE